jgi:hypothetical protein
MARRNIGGPLIARMFAGRRDKARSTVAAGIGRYATGIAAAPEDR